MIPGQRKPGQTGGRGGHGKNMHNAQKRDQRPVSGSGRRFPWKLLVFVVAALAAIYIIWS